jgi:hypothetical protein
MSERTRYLILPFTAAWILALSACGGALGTGGDGQEEDGEADGTDTAADPDAHDPVLDDAGEDPRPDLVVDPPVDPGVEDLPVPDVVDVDVVDSVEDPEPDAGCPLQVIQFEAEAMTLDDGFDTGWSNYLSDNYIISTRDNDGEASIVLHIPCTDTWVMWAAVWWENGTSDSFGFAWDDPAALSVWHVMQQCGTTISRGWYWDQVSRSPVSDSCDVIDEDPALMHLEDGPHTFYLFGREDGSAVAVFYLTNDPAWAPE